MPLMNRARLRRRSPLAVKRVPMPEWGEGVFLYARMLPAASYTTIRDLAEKSKAGTLPEEEYLARMCILGACDAKGAAVFEDSDVEHILLRPLKALGRWVEVFADLNGLGEDAETTRKKK